MSYCRWSTDDFKCDLYCYESNKGYSIHVAMRRSVPKEPLPAPMDLPPKGAPTEEFQAYADRFNEMLRIVGEADYEEITLPYAGETFELDTLEDFIFHLEMLKDLEYRFPDYVLEIAKEELEECQK